MRRLPLVAGLPDWGPVQHAGSAARLGSFVKETPRFAAADLLGLRGVRRYHLRDGGRPILLRHGTIDVWTFLEVFVRRLYEPPPAVAASLAETDEPLVLDLGANIGMFGVDVLTRRPGARVVAFEPDAHNAAIHRRLLTLDDAGGRWTLVEACAGAQDGAIRFLPGQETGSHIVGEDVAGSIELPMVDVLDQVAAADLVKMDIEGGEWPILADPRFGDARAVVLEYHRQGCPGDDPRELAWELLRSHGFDVIPVFDDPAGIGMVWATRSA